jgi:hypothetical protein
MTADPARTPAKVLRIGCGSAALPDPVRGAVAALERGNLDYICFDSLAEISMPALFAAKLADPATGYDPALHRRLMQLLPRLREHRTRMIGNFGGLNPRMAARVVLDTAGELGLHGLRVSWIEGDDVLEQLARCSVIDGGRAPWEDFDVVSANAYIGAEPIVDSLAQGADVVVAGRAADASMYLAPMMFEFGWAADDWDRLGAGILLGHLAECGTFATGGAWSDPNRRIVPGQADLGLPILEVDASLSASVTKTPRTGGVVHVDNLRAQLMHEIGDPAAYLSPDVVANFLSVKFAQADADHVAVTWNGEPRGRERPSHLKVLVGVHEGYIGEAMLLVAGENSDLKARQLADVARERFFDVLGLDLIDFRCDYIGMDSAVPAKWSDRPAPTEVMTRIAGLCADLATAQEVASFADYASMIGPVGIGARRKQVVPCFNVHAALIDRREVGLSVHLEEVL